MESSHPAGALTSVADGQRPKLLDQVRARMRRLGLAKRTEEAYVGWIRRFILAHGKRHPRDMGAREVEEFLSKLATVGNVAASTRNQALSALLFLYREVLGTELPWMDDIRRAKRPERLRVQDVDFVRREITVRQGVRCCASRWLAHATSHPGGRRDQAIRASSPPHSPYLHHPTCATAHDRSPCIAR